MIMAPIDDDELVLFHYRDGLPPERLEQIEQALAASPLLRHRYDKLRAVLASVDREPVPEAGAGFEERLWQQLQPRLTAATDAAPRLRLVESAVASPEPRLRHGASRARRYSRWSLGLASAAVVLLTFGLIFFAGTLREPTQPSERRAQSQNTQPAVQSHESARVLASQAMARRVLAMKVGEHLRSTEAVLLSVINSDSSTLDPAHTDIIASLVESNRLYSAAAARGGNRALAGFLRSLQPVLIELANQSGDGSIQSREGLRQFLSSTDLLFRVRAIETRLRAPEMNA